MERINVTIDWINNYAAGCAILPVVATEDTLEDVKKSFTEAFNWQLQAMKEDGDEIPTELQGEFELKFNLTNRALLHYYVGILSRKAISHITGINEKQLGHYIQGVRTPKQETINKIINGVHNLGKDLLSVG